MTQDPIFGWITYGGVLEEAGDTLSVIPRDGLRRRLAVVLTDPRPLSFKLELDRDGFQPESRIGIDKQLKKITFKLENRTDDQHTTQLKLSCHPTADYEVFQDGKKVSLAKTGIWNYPWRAALSIKEEPSTVEIRRISP